MIAIGGSISRVMGRVWCCGVRGFGVWLLEVAAWGMGLRCGCFYFHNLFIQREQN